MTKNNVLTISIHALREESDAACRAVGHGDHISIHALREESDVESKSRHAESAHFNPRSP